MTLDYAGNGSIGFNRRPRNGKIGQRVIISGCSPGVSSSPKQRGTCAGLVDEVFLTAAQLKKHLVYAETRRLNGDDDPNLQPQWLVMAHRDDPDSEESAFAGTAADLDHSTPGDNQDAEASPEWQLKFQ